MNMSRIASHTGPTSPAPVATLRAVLAELDTIPAMPRDRAAIEALRAQVLRAADRASAEALYDLAERTVDPVLQGVALDLALLRTLLYRAVWRLLLPTVANSLIVPGRDDLHTIDSLTRAINRHTATFFKCKNQSTAHRPIRRPN